jgi:hypothetical protein
LIFLAPFDLGLFSDGKSIGGQLSRGVHGNETIGSEIDGKCEIDASEHTDGIATLKALL